MKDNPDFWPEITEWCSQCKKTRHVKLVIDEKAKKLVKTRKDIEEVAGVTGKIKVVSEETDKEAKVLEVVKAEVIKEEDTVIGEVLSSPVSFWRPCEDRSEVSE